MKSRLVSILKNKELSGALIVSIALFVSSIFSYILQLSLGQLLTVLEYGEFTALLSLTSIFSVPVTALSTSAIKLTSELKAKDRFDILTNLFVKLTLFTLLFGICISFGLVIFKDAVSDYLRIDNHSLIIFFALNLAVSFIVITPFAYLQGLLRFKAFSFSSIASSFTRLVLPIIFVLLGFGVSGVFIGMCISIILSFSVGTLFLKKNFSVFGKENLSPHYKALTKVAFVALLMNVGMTLLNNIDIILVKHYFDGTSAGLYSAVVTMGKVLLFGTGSVSVVMFPQVSSAFSKGENYISKFKSFLAIQLLLVISGVLVFCLFPSIMLKILFPNFLASAQLLPAFSVFMGIYVLSNFMSAFFLAINKNNVFLLQIPVILVQFVLISFFHTSLAVVININIFVALLLLILIMLYYIGHVRFGHSSGL